jgi:phosphatidylinositol glycan class O
VNQIDLVPTLSLLLGIPIPFGNLGAAIPELFFRMDSSSQAETDPMRDIAGRFAALNRMLRLNALQVLCLFFFNSASV